MMCFGAGAVAGTGREEHGRKDEMGEE